MEQAQQQSCRGPTHQVKDIEYGRRVWYISSNFFTVDHYHVGDEGLAEMWNRYNGSKLGISEHLNVESIVRKLRLQWSSGSLSHVLAIFSLLFPCSRRHF